MVKGNEVKGPVYQPKKKEEESKKEKPATRGDGKPKSIFNLLSSLKPEAEEPASDEESQSDDEATQKLMGRKISMNRINVVGLNFEQYNDLKPTNAIKLRIHNLFMEYENSSDIDHAAGEFLEICESTGTDKFMSIGYILNNAFS